GGNSKNIGDPRLHGRAMRSDLRRFADQGYVQVSNDAAPARDKRRRMLEENGGVRTAPALVRRREGGADVAFADGAKDGVRQGVEARVRVGMAHEALIMGNAQATEGHMVAGAEAMDVKAIANTYVAEAGEQHPFRPRHVARLGHLEILLIPLDDGDRAAPGPEEGGIVRRAIVPGVPVGGQYGGKREGLRG